MLALKRWKRLSDHGKVIGRKGMSDLVIEAVNEFLKNGATPKGAMILAGRCKAISQMASSDDYWAEQVDKGFVMELHNIPPKKAGT